MICRICNINEAIKLNVNDKCYYLTKNKCNYILHKFSISFYCHKKRYPEGARITKSIER